MSTCDEKRLKFSKTGLPFVTVKFAQSLDGRIATATGDSRWISSEAARGFAHRLRSEHDAVMVGIGTVLADDPELTVRLVKGRDPLRIVVDSKLRIPMSARVLSDNAANRTLVATTEGADSVRAREIENMGAEVFRLSACPEHSGIDLKLLFEELGRRGVRSVLVEGGNRIITSLLAAGTVDRVIAIVAPKIIGQGIDAVGDLGIARLDDAITFASVKTRRLGPDIVFDGRVERSW